MHAWDARSAIQFIPWRRFSMSILNPLDNIVSLHGAQA